MIINVKRKIILLLIIIISLCCITINVYSKDAKNNLEAIAIINGKKVYKDISYDTFILNEQNIDSSNIVKEIVVEELIDIEVKRLSIEITDDDFFEYFDEFKKSYDYDDYTRDIFKKTLEINKLSAEEYWTVVKPFFRKLCNRSMYKLYLKNQYAKNWDENDNQYESEFENYYNNNIENLFITNNVILLNPKNE
jgi:hypothetical protein